MSRLRGMLIRLGSAIACRLPESWLVALADGGGELWYRLAPARAARARRNLQRVAVACARDGRGSALARRAASDPRALERLVRLAFRHAARYYAEVARTPVMDPADITRRLDLETPETIEAALAGGGPVILVGAHFGAVEVPVVYLAARVGYAFTAPMETVTDPVMQAWIERSRARAGIRVVPIEQARRALTEALRAGRSVGLIADRDLTGGGILVPFFGAPARMPVGAALLAIETGTPLFVGGARRAPGGRYIGRLRIIDVPAAGTRRQRTTRLVEDTVRAFETLIADAPEQWWAAFHPIWPDLEGEGLDQASTTARPEPVPEVAPDDAAAMGSREPPSGDGTGTIDVARPMTGRMRDEVPA